MPRGRIFRNKAKLHNFVAFECCSIAAKKKFAQSCMEDPEEKRDKGAEYHHTGCVYGDVLKSGCA